MPKNYSNCKLCSAKRFLNFAGLCKRCNQKPESAKFSDAAVVKMRADRKQKAADNAEAAAQAAEEKLEQAEAEGGEEASEESKESKEEEEQK